MALGCRPVSNDEAAGRRRRPRRPAGEPTVPRCASRTPAPAARRAWRWRGCCATARTSTRRRSPRARAGPPPAADLGAPRRPLAAAVAPRPRHAAVGGRRRPRRDHRRRPRRAPRALVARGVVRPAPGGRRRPLRRQPLAPPPRRPGAPGGAGVYNPASGKVGPLTFPVGRWTHPWFAVTADPSLGLVGGRGQRRARRTRRAQTPATRNSCGILRGDSRWIEPCQRSTAAG